MCPGGVGVQVIESGSPADALSVYLSGRADAYVLDRSALAGIRSSLASPGEHHILADTISYEPMAPYVAVDNVHLFQVARHVLFTLINAETARALDRVEAFIEATDALAERRQLHQGWCRRVLEEVGDYGMMYARNLGDASPLMLPRSPLNRPVTSGGAHFAPP